MIDQKIDISGKIKALEMEMDRIAHQHQAKQVLITQIQTAIQTREREAETEILKETQRIKTEMERDMAKKRSELKKEEDDLKRIETENEKHHRDLETFKRTLEETLNEDRLHQHNSHK